MAVNRRRSFGQGLISSIGTRYRSSSLTRDADMGGMIRRGAQGVEQKRGRTREGRCASTRPGRGCRRETLEQARPARKRGWPRHPALEGWAGGDGTSNLSKPKPAVPGGGPIRTGHHAAAAQATEGLTAGDKATGVRTGIHQGSRRLSDSNHFERQRTDFIQAKRR